MQSTHRGVPINTAAEEENVSSIGIASSYASANSQTHSATGASSLPSAAATPAEGATGIFTMHEFHRSEIRDGRKLWEVKGKQAQYSPENSSVTITDADLSLVGKTGKEGRLQTKKATLFMQGPSLLKARLQNGVTAIYDGTYTLTSDEAECDRSSNTVVIPGRVKVESTGIELSGDSLRADTEGQKFVLSGNVVTILKPRAKNPLQSLKGSAP